MAHVLGLDIGGANTKSCYLKMNKGIIQAAKGRSVYHEIWRNPEGLRDVLNGLKTVLKKTNLDGVALTMTAELCDGFESKSQGVLYILGIVEDVFKDVPVYVWTTEGNFVLPEEIKNDPLQAAAANWLASASALAHCSIIENPSILVDMGSTTTDILPVSPGKVHVKGKTDIERLQSGELLYTGVLRTAINAILKEAYIDGVSCQVANEYFAISADVYRYLELITDRDYDVPTPDGGEKGLEGCAKRLARVVASEPLELGAKNIFFMAKLIQEKQGEQIVNNILRLSSRKDIPQPSYLITTGQGSFILDEVARRLGYKAIPWWRVIQGAKPHLAMASFAVSALLAKELTGRIWTGDEKTI
ncbi:MAG: hypothetical protein GX434_05530 [Peptococcaceae bacterium]|nr:hypothetical protein [Peptococcaceae bacterium]